MGTTNIREELQELIFNEKKRQHLIENGRKFVGNYMSNHGVASKNLAEIINRL